MAGGRLPSLDLAARRTHGGDWSLRVAVPVGLLGLAAVGWWWSVRMADDMSGGGVRATGMGEAMSLGSFFVAWVAMMAAMMLPAVMPVVRLYACAAAHGRAAPVPFFITGYLAVWATVGVPAYLAWRALEMPLADGRAWTGRVAGATLFAAALWQRTPLKSICLRHCRSPMGFFLRVGGRLARPAGALRMGAMYGLFCFGCCWALFAVLVSVGTMNLLWMVALAGLVLLEKNSAQGELVARAGGFALVLVGSLLLISPSMLTHIT